MRIRMNPRTWIGLTLFLAIGACVTVNIYFPAAQVENAAKQIVDDVYGAQPQGNATDSQSSLRRMFALLGPAQAYAQEATSVSNAAIRSLKEQIARNHQQLAPFYGQGAVGITNNGMLAVRDTAGLPVAQVGQIKRLVAADNQAREQLYQEVARALNVDPSQIGRIKDIFAKEWQFKAGSGWWIQEAGGQWRKK